MQNLLISLTCFQPLKIIESQITFHMKYIHSLKKNVNE